jgi:DNA mismatch repair protein MutS
MGAGGGAGTGRHGDAEREISALRMGEKGQAGKPALQEESKPAAHGIVLNDVHFGEEGRVFVLTGPNRGGKTTFTQAVGLSHVLYQAGLLVPGTRARLSPVDAILTHFPMAEEYSLEAGRLGEEAQRLAAIFRRATPHSLILLNESLFSTSPGESLYLARDVVRALRYLGTRAIYATHLHELAANVEEINQQTPGEGRVASLVATVDRVAPGEGGAEHCSGDNDIARPTFRIETGPPMGLSYARQIATRYGISFEQLANTIDRRVTKP